MSILCHIFFHVSASHEIRNLVLPWLLRSSSSPPSMQCPPGNLLWPMTIFHSKEVFIPFQFLPVYREYRSTAFGILCSSIHCCNHHTRTSNEIIEDSDNLHMSSIITTVNSDPHMPSIIIWVNDDLHMSSAVSGVSGNLCIPNVRTAVVCDHV